MTAGRGAPAEARETVLTVLNRHGLRYRTKQAGGVTWYNLANCPLCKHGGYQCGISESAGAGGRLIHGVKCWHVADNGLGTDTPAYEDFLLALGEVITRRRGGAKTDASRRSRPAFSPPAPDGGRDLFGMASLRPLNLDYHGRLRKRLRENPDALRILKGAAWGRKQ